MEKFNIANKIKRDLVRKIKRGIGNNDYTELAVMYRTENKGEFFITETSQIEKLEYEGNCFYKLFTHYKADGNITLGEIERTIFS